jgi:hypothetical protein
VTVIKVLIIYHSWIHPLHHSTLSSLPHSWNSFNMSHFSIFIHEYIIFHHIHPPTPFPYVLPLPLVPTPRQDLFCLPVLCFGKKRKHTHLFLYKEFLFDIFMYLCITTQIGSSPLFFSSAPLIPSYGDFNRFKNSLLILVQKVHQPYSPSYLSLLPSSSRMWPPPAWPVFITVLVFVLGLYSTCEGTHVAFGFLNLARMCVRVCVHVQIYKPIQKFTVSLPEGRGRGALHAFSWWH